jgi:hypothetical protein
MGEFVSGPSEPRFDIYYIVECWIGERGGGGISKRIGLWFPSMKFILGLEYAER